MRRKKRFLMVFLAVVLAFSAVGFVAQPTQAASCAFYHTVKRGESLSVIGSYYGISWKYIADTNDIVSPYTIYPGQQLCMPSGTGYTYWPGYYYPVYYPPATTWSYRVVSVVRDSTVTIETYNFPDNVWFAVEIGCWGCGSAMVKVTDMDSDRGGTFRQRFTIPSEYVDYSQLVIRLTQAKKGTSMDRVFRNSTFFLSPKK